MRRHYFTSDPHPKLYLYWRDETFRGFTFTLSYLFARYYITSDALHTGSTAARPSLPLVIDEIAYFACRDFLYSIDSSWCLTILWCLAHYLFRDDYIPWWLFYTSATRPFYFQRYIVILKDLFAEFMPSDANYRHRVWFSPLPICRALYWALRFIPPIWLQYLRIWGASAISYERRRFITRFISIRFLRR